MKALILALALASVAPVAGAQTGISKQAAVPAYGDPISLTEAQAIVDRTIRAAREAGHRMAVAIVEPNGELVAFARMDDTQYGSILVAQRKATTAARYRTSTAALEERVLSGRTVTLGNEDVLPIAGGLPIVIDGRIVGAIGVSGASAAEDATIAAAALAAD
ncbi:GlcG/HbpS family heme-binding protein [Brevundimonas sp.]